MDDENRLLAAIAAALLGSQGSPIWTRTAEQLLLSSPEMRSLYHRARLELERLMDSQSSPQ
jgi:hypothetical protein